MPFQPKKKFVRNGHFHGQAIFMEVFLSPIFYNNFGP
jgi:hypothetical protein